MGGRYFSAVPQRKQHEPNDYDLSAVCRYKEIGVMSLRLHAECFLEAFEKLRPLARSFGARFLSHIV